MGASPNTGIQIKPLGQMLQQINRYGQQLFQPPKDTIRGVDPDTWYSPLQPMQPIGPAGVEPRAFQYWAGQNLLFTPRADAEFSAAQLKILAAYPVARMCIENVKDVLCKTPWEIQPKQKIGESRKQANKRAAGNADLIKLNRFFEYPDREHNWQEWLRPLLDDLLTIDAPAILVRKTFKGEIVELPVIRGDCYSDDTEVLTEGGWKLFANVDISSDRVATRNQTTKVFEWQQPTAFHAHIHNGDMCHLHSATLDLLVTPTHRQIVRRRQRGAKPHDEKIELAAKLCRNPGRLVLPVTSDWIGNEIQQVKIPDAASLTPISRFGFCSCGCGAKTKPASRTVRSYGWKKGVPIDYVKGHQAHMRAKSGPLFSGDDFAAFMGMYLAEGSTVVGTKTTSAGHYRVCITQAKTSKGFKPYQKLLVKIFSTDLRRDKKNWIIANKSLHGYLRQFGRASTKFVPQEILSMSSRQLKIFWHYFWLGDGDTGRNRVATTSKRLAGQLQEIAQKMGVSAGINVRAPKDTAIHGRLVRAENCQAVHIVSLRQTPEMGFNGRLVPYSGKVFCLTVPNGTLYVRRNGQPAWSCNSIVRYIDENGFTPMAPQPAYAQNWWGIPLVNLSTDQLIYKPRNIVPRNTVASQLYGMSPTEQLSTEIQIGLQRLAFVLLYYTEGSIPGVVQVVPRGVTTKEISAAMMWMNSELAGNLAARQQWRMVQGFNEPGKADQIVFAKEKLLSDPYDDLLIRKICFGYGTSPQRLLKMMNRASSESNQEGAESEGTLPWLEWIQGLMNYIIAKKFNYPDFEIIFDPSGEVDPEKNAGIIKTYVGSAVLTPNEGRGRLGEERVETPEADMLGVITGTGFMPLQMATAQAGAEIDKKGNVTITSPKENPNAAFPGNSAAQGGGGGTAGAGAGKKTGGKSANGNGNGHGEHWAHCGDHGKFAAGCAGCSTAVTAQITQERETLEKKRKLRESKPKPTIHPGRLLPQSILAKHAIEKVMVAHFKPMERKTTRELRKSVEKVKAAGLLGAGRGLTKASGDEDEALKAILKQVAADWRAIADEVLDPLTDAALAGANSGLLQLEVTDEDMLGAVNEVARDWAAKRAAELVGMKLSDKGNLVKNPDAKFAISDTTRDKLRTVIRDIFSEESPTLSDIEDRIMASGIFSDERATMIAKTEISRAQTKGNIDAWKKSGIAKMVDWRLSGIHDQDDECDDLADNSPYPIDGVPEFPAHPNCMCALVLNEGEE